MKKIIILVIAFFGAICVMFTAISPDIISTIVSLVMAGAVFFGIAFGIIPNLRFAKGFRNGLDSIKKAKETSADNIWTAVFNQKPFFKQKVLDDLFDSYTENVKEQREKGIIISDIDDVINEDTMAVRSWRGVVLQIAGTLTSLGLLGTFLGLITGVSSISFSTVEATMSSIEILLKGIATAFYTSIIGVILSILFNVVYRLIWNGMLRQLQVFLDEFHTKIQPYSEDRIRAKQFLNSEKMMETLAVIKDNSSQMASGINLTDAQEQRLMIDIISGVDKGEFTFLFEPIIETSTKEMIKATAILRWNHEILGAIHPSAYMPIIKSNGYITKLNRKLWDDVCKTIKEWKDEGKHPLPVVLNIRKSDLLSLDIPEYINNLLDTYSLEPRDIEIGIEGDCYKICADEAKKAESALIKKGIRVRVVDFNGNFLDLGKTSADEVSINLGNIESLDSLKEIFKQAQKAHINLSAENVTSAKQLADILKLGCKTASGKHLNKEMTKKEFENSLQG